MHFFFSSIMHFWIYFPYSISSHLLLSILDIKTPPNRSPTGFTCEQSTSYDWTRENCGGFCNENISSLVFKFANELVTIFIASNIICCEKKKDKNVEIVRYHELRYWYWSLILYFIFNFFHRKLTWFHLYWAPLLEISVLFKSQ